MLVTTQLKDSTKIIGRLKTSEYMECVYKFVDDNLVPLVPWIGISNYQQASKEEISLYNKAIGVEK